MFKAIGQFFTMITVLFSAGESAANSLNNLAQAGEAMTESVKNDAIDEAKIKKLKRDAMFAKSKAKAEKQIAEAQAEAAAVKA